MGRSERSDKLCHARGLKVGPNGYWGIGHTLFVHKAVMTGNARTELPEVQKERKRLGTVEFVALMALIISLVALSVDAILPALPSIAQELGASDNNQVQLVVSFIFIGFAVGQIFCGPLSDSVGRKRAVYAGIVLFVTGCLLSIFATTFSMMLLGRVLQGTGGAAPRIVSTALIRDQYAGRDMARIMSMIMAVFIVAPAIAPAIGQLVLEAAHWRAIFGLLMVQAIIAVLWFALRQPETLGIEKRRPFSLSSFFAGVREFSKTRTSVTYTATAGLAFAALIGYLTSAQQIFQGLYAVGDRFALYFSILALSIGLASAVNSRLVMRIGMVRLSGAALILKSVLATIFFAVAWQQDGIPPLWQFMTYMVLSFFCVGILFGNFNAMAMEPLGHIAGTASATIGFGSTVISLVLGTVIGQCYDGTVLPLVGGFAALGWVALTLVLRAKNLEITAS